jgi:uncharacterized membrane protein
MWVKIMWGYQRRLARDLETWTAKGWVTPDARARILADAASHGREFNLPSVLGILASVLLGFAAISFVAAHWDDMPRLARLALLIGLLWAGYGAAGVFAMRVARAFADVAVLFSTALFGASIMLISQMFHINGNPPDGVLLWWLGALLAGVALRSNPALALSLVLVCVWAGMETAARDRVYWPFLIGWGLITAAFIWQRWRPGVHLAGLALTVFVVALGYLLKGGHEHMLVTGLGLAGVAVALSVELLRADLVTLRSPLLGYAMVTAFAGLFAIQFVDTISNSALILTAGVTLVLLLAAIAYGLSREDKGALWIGYVAFSIEILALYWKTVGSILDTSLFFLIAGLIVAALAALAWRLASRSASQRGQA